MEELSTDKIYNRGKNCGAVSMLIWSFVINLLYGLIPNVFIYLIIAILLLLFAYPKLDKKLDNYFKS